MAGRADTIARVDEHPSAHVLICLLGSFRLQRDGLPVAVRPGGKVEDLLGCLALAPVAAFVARSCSI
jgi:hypothetical protein